MFKQMRSIVRVFLLALITVVVAGIIVKLDYSHALKTANSDNSDKVIVQIKDGETVDQILNTLTTQGLMNEKWSNYFKIYLRLNKLTSQLQAGTYNIPQNLNIVELINTLQNGKNPEAWVTVQEGLRKDEIADILVRNLGSTFSKDTFLSLTTDQEFIATFGLNSDVKDLEGYLFPDKYAFVADVTEKEVITKMVGNFKTKVGTSDSYNNIIIASIVEREGYNSTDRPIIAGIIIKRYNEGWLLQTDATLLYEAKDWKANVSAYKTSNSPYNTYKVVGLPPTPICNPGLESINAVRNPSKTDYYYYIHDNNKVPHYAITLDVHNQNINTYLK